MSETVIGVDISNETFVASRPQKDAPHREFVNQKERFEEFGDWLEQQSDPSVRVCMEATGAYGLELAIWLVEQGYRTSVVNPRRVRSYAESELNRNKTDPADAACIARFCQAQDPDDWEPASQARRMLQQLIRRVFNLKDMLASERNRRQQPAIEPLVAADIDKHIQQLEERLEEIWEQIEEWIDQHSELKEAVDLLTSIPGIAYQTAAKLVGEIQDIERFGSAKELAAYAGVTPQNIQSGSSIDKPASMSKIGPSRLRAVLYMPAVSAKTHNPIVQQFCQRLEQKGKHSKAVIGAAMHKLIRLVYGVWSKKNKFDPDYLDAS